MNQIVLGNTLRDWAFAVGGALVVWLLIGIVRRLLVRRLDRSAAGSARREDELLVEVVRSVRPAYLGIAALGFGLLTLELPLAAIIALRWTVAIALVLQAFRSTDRLVEFWLGRYAARRGAVDRTTLSALSIALRGFVFLVVAIVALHNLGVNVVTLITTFGVGGIAIALALQNILGDLFGALSIVLDKPFVVGDTIAVDQIEGTVEHVGLKTTRVRSVNGEQVVFSNADLLKSRLRNFSRREGRRLVFTVSVAPETTAAQLARVPAIITEVVAAESRANLQRAHLVGMGPLGFDVETSILIPHPDYNRALDARQAILLELYARLGQERIALARPVPAAVVSATVAAPPPVA